MASPWRGYPECQSARESDIKVRPIIGIGTGLEVGRMCEVQADRMGIAGCILHLKMLSS